MGPLLYHGSETLCRGQQMSQVSNCRLRPQFHRRLGRTSPTRCRSLLKAVSPSNCRLVCLLNIISCTDRHDPLTVAPRLKSQLRCGRRAERDCRGIEQTVYEMGDVRFSERKRGRISTKQWLLGTNRGHRLHVLKVQSKCSGRVMTEQFSFGRCSNAGVPVGDTNLFFRLRGETPNKRSRVIVSLPQPSHSC